MAKQKNIRKISDGLTPDYFKLPFEVYYSGPIEIEEFEFRSDVEEIKKFSDIKAVHVEEGRAYGANFLCNINTGSELYCCIVGGLDDAIPDWLMLEQLDDVNMNYGYTHAVLVNGNDIKFTSEIDVDIESMGMCDISGFQTLNVRDDSPDYIILDAHESRLRVNTEGYVLDDDDEPIESQQVFNLDEMNLDNYGNHTKQSRWDLKAQWVKNVLSEEFPKEKNLKFSKDSE